MGKCQQPTRTSLFKRCQQTYATQTVSQNTVINANTKKNEQLVEGNRSMQPHRQKFGFSCAWEGWIQLLHHQKQIKQSLFCFIARPSNLSWLTSAKNISTKLQRNLHNNTLNITWQWVQLNELGKGQQMPGRINRNRPGTSPVHCWYPQHLLHRSGKGQH